MAQKKSQSSAATKEDIGMLMQHIGKLYDDMEKWKEEIKSHFDLRIELAIEDFKGAMRDRQSVHTDHIANHDRRIVRLERHAGLAAA